jgi:hypothetical protein
MERSIPPFAEMMPGAKEITKSYFSNAERYGGTLLTAMEASSEQIFAFYRSSLQKHGLKAVEETTTPRGVVILKGLSSDGKRELRIEVNPSKTSRRVVQLNFVTSRK